MMAAILLKMLLSHPSWVRGLKFTSLKCFEKDNYVASFMGAWIEISPHAGQTLSIPVASFMGAWIEMYMLPMTSTSILVASFMGAWIEIREVICFSDTIRVSHPSWVRGLK